MVNKVYSIIVAYNPVLEELKDCIEKLKKQTELVIVCNNSVDDIQIEDALIKIFNFRENLGIAKAQSIGMKWAFENGADFILQIDQDSIPDDSLVENLLYCYNELTQKGYKIGLVGSQDFDKDSKIPSKAKINKGKNIENEHYLQIKQLLSSGSLIPKKTYLTIGGMEDELFIDIVDFEYCWRLSDSNFLIVKNKEAKILHKLGYGTRKLFGIFKINIGAPFRHYYQFRNILLMMNRRYVPLMWKISQIIKLLFKLIFYFFGLKDGKERFKFMLLGIKDYFSGKLGKM